MPTAEIIRSLCTVLRCQLHMQFQNCMKESLLVYAPGPQTQALFDLSAASQRPSSQTGTAAKHMPNPLM